VQGLFDDDSEKTGQDAWSEGSDARKDEPVILSSYSPPSEGETIRSSGLAYSAGIALFVAVVIMGFVGWIADQLLGSSPWGIVGGIVLGSIIGFLQLFRISSQIFQKDSSAPSEHPLMSTRSGESERRDRFD